MTFLAEKVIFGHFESIWEIVKNGHFEAFGHHHYDPQRSSSSSSSSSAIFIILAIFIISAIFIIFSHLYSIAGPLKALLFISNFMLFLRVFWTFLKNAARDLAENRYLDRTNHYLQLLYWSSGPKNYGFRAKVRQSPFLGSKRAQACLGRHPA